MTVYVDIVLIENIAMNYIILLASSLISKKKINFFKIFVSSFIGGIYSIVNYVLEVSMFVNILFKVFISFVMIKIAFESNSFKNFFKQLMIFYLVSFTLGGTSFMLLFFVNPKAIIFEKGHLIGTYPIKIAILGGVVGFTIISVVNNLIRKKLENQICEIEIYYNGKTKKLKTFIDSGNLLKEPISMADVIIVEKESLIDIVDYNFLNNIDKILNGKMLSDGIDFTKNKIKLIPFSSLGNENGMLIGFKPDYIKIYSDETRIARNVIIGIYNGKLTKSNLYTSLIGLNILKESDTHDKFITNT